MKNRMFVIPGSFVPYNDTVTLLTYKRLRNVDMEMDVFCFKGKEDKGLLEELKNDPQYTKFHIQYSSDLDWSIPRNYPLRLPISLFLMYKYVRDSLSRFEKKEYTHLFSSIVPGISHIAAYRIKKKHPNVLWYASFSDPFKGSPYKKADLKDKSIIYWIAYHVGSFFLYNSRYEEVAVNHADKLIFICEEQRDFTLKQYKNYEELKEKAIIMPLTYIPSWKMYSDLLDAEKAEHSPKQAVHLGRLYGLRKIDTFLEALKQLKQEDQKPEEKIVFHQYSEIQKEDVRKIKEYHLENLFVIHEKVSYDESIEIMKNADILVLFDTLMPDQPLQPYLPSKIVEYLMLKKPILGICGANSPSYRILKEYGFTTVGCDIEIIKKHIHSLINGIQVQDYSLDRLNSDRLNMLE